MVAVGSRYARVAIMSGDAEDTMLTPGSKAICNRQRGGRDDLGVSHIHSFMREPEFCVHKLSSDPVDEIGLRSPSKTRRRQLCDGSQTSKSDLCEHSSTSAIVDRSLINRQVP
jgi:hypothetical protein